LGWIFINQSFLLNEQRLVVMILRVSVVGIIASMLQDTYAAIGSGAWPVVIFLVVALIFHIALGYTRYGKFTYAIGANVQAARVSGIMSAAISSRFTQSPVCCPDSPVSSPPPARFPGNRVWV
jgi:ABC-type xylose transport system permease subunit